MINRQTDRQTDRDTSVVGNNCRLRTQQSRKLNRLNYYYLSDDGHIVVLLGWDSHTCLRARSWIHTLAAPKVMGSDAICKICHA